MPKLLPPAAVDAEELDVTDRSPAGGMPRLSIFFLIMMIGQFVVRPHFYEEGKEYAERKFYASGEQAIDAGALMFSDIAFSVFLVGMALILTGADALYYNLSSLLARVTCKSEDDVNAGEPLNEGGQSVGNTIIATVSGGSKMLLDAATLYGPDAAIFMSIAYLMAMASTQNYTLDSWSRTTASPDKTIEQIDHDAHALVEKYGSYLTAAQVGAFFGLLKLFRGARCASSMAQEASGKIASLMLTLFGNGKICGSRLLGAINAADQFLKRNMYTTWRRVVRGPRTYDDNVHRPMRRP